MKSATIREVQHNLAKYLRRVELGEEIEIRRRNKIIAKLIPSVDLSQKTKKVDWSIVAERRRKQWGGKPLPGKPLSEIVYEARGDR